MYTVCIYLGASNFKSEKESKRTHTAYAHRHNDTVSMSMIQSSSVGGKVSGSSSIFFGYGFMVLHTHTRTRTHTLMAANVVYRLESFKCFTVAQYKAQIKCECRYFFRLCLKSTTFSHSMVIMKTTIKNGLFTPNIVWCFKRYITHYVKG